MRIGEKPEIARLPLFRDMAEKQRDLVLAGSYLQVFLRNSHCSKRGRMPIFCTCLSTGW